jgi:coenzyme F420 hydrogenase subunit beta
LKPHPLIGPTLEIWEGHAAENQIHFSGASGGVLTALALYCLEREAMEFVLHVGMDPEKPWLNKTALSKDRAQLLERNGSRYAPSSPCEALNAIEQSKRPCVFIGKPCDTAAVTMVRRYRPGLDEKLGLVLTFFCAGPPSTQATLKLLKQLEIPLEEINEIRYRGNGWPGNFSVLYRNRREEKLLTYEESWGSLADYPRSFRCHLCPDGLGELADIACGDAWHRYTGDGNKGLSLLLVRSERGREILHRAAASGYLKLSHSGPDEVIKAQDQLQRRKEVYGRLLTMRRFFIPTPRFIGFPLRQNWSTNSWRIKAHTILGTMKRIIRRNLWRRTYLFS